VAAPFFSDRKNCAYEFPAEVETPLLCFYCPFQCEDEILNLLKMKKDNFWSMSFYLVALKQDSDHVDLYYSTWVGWAITRLFEHFNFLSLFSCEKSSYVFWVLTSYNHYLPSGDWCWNQHRVGIADGKYSRRYWWRDSFAGLMSSIQIWLFLESSPYPHIFFEYSWTGTLEWAGHIHRHCRSFCSCCCAHCPLDQASFSCV